MVDVGGGTGRYTTAIHGPRGRMMAPIVLDPSVPMLHEGHKKQRPHHRVAGVADRLPFADGSIRAITVTEALHHFPPDIEPFVREAARVMRDDGILLIEEPDPTRVLGKLLAAMERVGRLGSTFRAPADLSRETRRRFGHVRTQRSGASTYLLEATQPHKTQAPPPQS